MDKDSEKSNSPPPPKKMKLTQASPSVNATGITQIDRIDYSYLWTIRNFHLCSKKTGEALLSPEFLISADYNIKGFLAVYPKGKLEEHKDHLSLFFYLKSFKKPNIQAEYTFYIIDGEKRKRKKHEIQFCFEKENIGYGVPMYLKSSCIFNKSNNLLPNNNLSILLELRIGLADINFTSEMTIMSSEIDHQSKFLNDFGLLLENKDLCDTTLVANGKIFHAHKLILIARSTVFASMFQDSLLNDKEIKIMDFDHETINEMLNYIYTGKVSKLDSLAKELLILGEKYALDGLKLMCEKFLCSKLNSENCIDILATADLYKAERLKEQAVNFIILHKKEVTNTLAYKSLKDSQAHLIAEIFRIQAMKRINL